MVQEADLPSEKHTEGIEGVIYYLKTNENNRVQSQMLFSCSNPKETNTALWHYCTPLTKSVLLFENSGAQRLDMIQNIQKGVELGAVRYASVQVGVREALTHISATGLQRKTEH